VGGDDTQDTGSSDPKTSAMPPPSSSPPWPAEPISFFCMGQADSHVNIWQWKADWQADIDRAYAGVAAANPDMHVDYYPQPDDPAFNPARAVGNPLATLERSTPIENLVAGGAGTLTTSDIQTVQGRGEWRDGRWRVLFVRRLSESGDGQAKFASGEGNDAAFAVWNGSAGDRDGQKSFLSSCTWRSSRSAPGAGTTRAPSLPNRAAGRAAGRGLRSRLVSTGAEEGPAPERRRSWPPVSDGPKRRPQRLVRLSRGRPALRLGFLTAAGSPSFSCFASCRG
jgi:hypothetical protein